MIEKTQNPVNSLNKLFFLNLGGYQSGKLEEQLYTMLCVKPDKAQAIQDSKKTIFFKSNTIKGANSHIDEKYGIDVNDVYRIEYILNDHLKFRYHIQISPAGNDVTEDHLHLG